jgi:UDPglucose 6-dehydrogenase
MRIAVYGLWHLGCVTAAGAAAAGHDVVGLDPDAGVVDALGEGRAPLLEPGLDDQIASGIREGRLRFTTRVDDALARADVLWVTFDTPVDDTDTADVAAVRTRLDAVEDSLRPGALVVVSSQVPTGFARALARDWRPRGVTVVSMPENLRLGRALEVFARPDRVVVGLENAADRGRVEPLTRSFGWRVEWMTLESAEMTKHAINAFLATTVTFANELARVCEGVGADALEVERGLKSDARIGERPYLSAGAPFAGGTLARDLRFLASFGRTHGTPTPLVDGVLASNADHEGWVRGQLERHLARVGGSRVAVLGLAYKPGTSTLRRSSALALVEWLLARGVTVRAHDPAVRADAPELPAGLVMCATVEDALQRADAAVIATAWPEYRDLDQGAFRSAMSVPCVIDQAGAVAGLFESRDLTYIAPGRRSDEA